ncbi:MAG: roadblock/LC7 domain-containing protein [bacterium]|nr:roadblock/LC7 domain-containing protein [bacterium]
MKQATGLLKTITGVQGVRAAVLASGDGFAMEAEIRDSSIDPELTAVLTRDAVAAARKMFSELDQSQFIQGIYEYTKGTILFANLPGGAYLVILASKDAEKAKVWNGVASNFKDLLKVL